MPDRPDQELRTRFANEAIDLAGALNAALGSIRLRPAGYRPELTAPEGPSTQGGTWALQHLRLVPQLEGMRTLVVGHANRVEKKAELRDFDHVDALHRKQFAVPVELHRKDYDEFLELAASLFQLLQLDTTISGKPHVSILPGSASLNPPRAARTTVVVAFVLGALVATLLAVAFVLARGR